MEDLSNQLYNFAGEFGKPSSPFFVFFVYLIFHTVFSLCRFGISKLNNIIIL